TRITEIDEIRLRVGRGTVRRGRAGKDLRLRGELGVDLQPNDSFPPAHLRLAHDANFSGRRRCQSVSFWKACAAFRIFASPKCGPTICRPTGSDCTKPHGTEMAGRPARFAPMV